MRIFFTDFADIHSKDVFLTKYGGGTFCQRCIF